ncbi:MAG TPA: hypothetical protein VF131_17975 [Blastocatellia bacterium]|nr:hypothetical protein [Blastocatellia bacterium]
MANAYLLNGTVSPIRVKVNTGTDIFLDALNIQTPNSKMTAKLGLASSPSPGVLGMGSNEVVVIIGGLTTTWKVELSAPVTIALDVQLIIFANQLQPKNTVSTAGFTITKIPSSEIVARGEGGETGESSLDATQPPSIRRPPAVRGATSGELTFKLLAFDTKGVLYEASNNSTSGDGVTWTYYYLFGSAGTPPPTLTLQESWDQVGAYVFLNAQEDPRTLLTELDTALSRQDTNFSRLAWRVSAGEYNIVQASTASAVESPATFAIGGWQLLLRRNTRLDLDTEAPGIKLLKASAEQTILVQFERNQNPQPIGTRPEEILLPLDGLHRGTLTLAWVWDHFQLGKDLGGNLRMFYGADAESASVAQYPLFTPASNPGPFPQNDLPFFVYLQPLAPLDGSRTRLALDLELPNSLTSKYLSSTTNAPVSLKPAAPSNGDLTAGFGFAKNTGLQESDCYLCPVGEFEVEAPGAGGSTRVQIRGGTAGTEYVLVEPGDRLSFENGRPAFAQGYQPQGGAPTELDDSLTTSWVRVIHKNIQNAGQAGEVVDTSYCAQSSASTYFGAAADGSPYAYPIAVGASLVQFETAERDALFPMLPYGGVFYQDDEEGIPNPNPNLSAKELGSIEQQVVAPDRRDQLKPYFDMTYGPIFFDTSTNVAFNGGFARTPLGLLAELNPVSGGSPPSGTIKRILLARSPQTPDQYLSLRAGANGVVNPQFTNTVLNDNLFLVATDARALDPFANEIKLGDFTFRVNLGDGDSQSIALFKFVPGVSARSLIGDSDAWDTLIGDPTPEKIRAIQLRLEHYLEVADRGGELYADFRRKIDDPNWNGLLFFNVALNYQALPLDIQILLGGIQGPLFAHHFGVTINQVGVRDTSMSLDQSSLFSVINYQAEFRPPPSPPLSWYPNFQVLLFNVRYANSKLAVFDSQIAFSIKDLFGSPVSLKKSAPHDKPNSGTIVIDGVYTLFEDGTGSLVFSTKDLRSFVYDVESGKLRVCEAQSVTSATLVPVTQSAGAGGATIASSQFKLSGLLAFRNSIGGDLFSYGKVENDVPVEGLAIAGYAFAMDTTIKGDEATLAPIKTFLDGLRVDQVLSKARDESLKRSFPSAIEAVTITPGGLRPTKTGEWTVKVDGSDFKAAPVYSLTFNVPLGNLGALLSTKTDLTAQLFVGWVPGGAANQADTVGLVLRLPAQVAGPSGFQFEGIISSSFEYVQLNRFKFRSGTGGDDTQIYCLLFVHYQGFLLNMLFNYIMGPLGPKDLGLFGGPSDPGGSNALYFVGKSVDSNWNGPQLSILLDEVPIVFLGRSYAIKTDPTNPNVISDVFDKLNPTTLKTVEEFASLIYANASLYNSDAGIAFALKFKFKSLELTAVLHDSTFYGAQIKITPEKPKPPNGGGKLLTQGGTALVLADDDKKKSFKEQIKDFTFTIIYRKVSDTVGVWSADIYLNLGQINIGAFQLSLPNFSISIWTNGDWRFAIGWPFEGSGATPITVQFQAGPFPIIAKCGFYLGKLSSAAAPQQFGTKFNLIWTFGLGIAAGVGKEWKSGPFKAGASLILGLTVQGFLASFSGNMTDDGVDYWWWGISLSLTGNVFGKVDFKVIVVDVSLTVTITIAFAIETKHSTPLTMTAQVKVKASLKILFIKITFSFEAKLDIFSFTFGSGPVAKLSGPTPTAVLESASQPVLAMRPRRFDPELVREVSIRAAAVEARAAGSPDAPVVAAAKVELSIGFVLQPTSISEDAISWAPQGVGTLVITTGDQATPFGKLAAGLAQWLIAAYGGTGTFQQQLEAVTVALQLGAFDSQVSTALEETFVFSIGRTLTQETAVVSMPVHPTLRIEYDGSPVHAATDATPRSSFGARRLPSNYFEMSDSYFSGVLAANALLAEAEGNESTAGTVFDQYFVMLAQQLIQLLEETGAPDLQRALAELDLGDLGGFVSRFLMAGVRLPDPENPSTLEALYILTGQQFPLKKVEGNWLLDSKMVGTALTPAWIKVLADTISKLDLNMVHTKGPSAPPWTISQMRALEPGPVILPMNDNLGWEDSAGSSFVISRFSEKVTQAIRDWRRETGATTGPWLSQELVGGESDADQQVDLAKGGIPWKASASLLIPIRLAAIPDPSGASGEILADIFSLMGTDEANRAALQALLNDPRAAVRAVDLLYSPSRGNWKSTKIPNVLVRTDLSTSNAPGVAAQNAVSEAGSPNCSNYAKLGEGGEQLMRFLRLVWEVSVVHSDGFYLQVENLDLQMFDQGPADLMLLVRFGTVGSIVQATAYQNSLVGEAPEEGKAIFSTVASDAAGTPVQKWAAAYPGGSVGWSITWENAPDQADASSDRFLESLYQMVSYRVEKINGQPIATSWSRPVTAQDESPEQGGRTTWHYQKAFETAPVTGSANRYADVNDTFTVHISIEDIFGNTLPESMLPVVDLNVLYNDDILGLGDWVGTQAFYLITSTQGGEGVELKLQLSLDTTVVTDSEGKIDPEQLARTTLLYQQLADQLTDPNMKAAADTGKVLAPAPLDKLTDGTTLLSGLSNFVELIVDWLEAGGTGAGPAPVTLSMSVVKSQPTAWPGDLQELVVTLILERLGVSDEIAKKAPEVRRVDSPVQPVEEPTSEQDPTGLTPFADNFERAYYPFDGKKGVIKVATGTNSDLSSLRFGRRSIWLQRWGVDAGTAVKILNDASALPVFYAPPPLSTQLITRTVDGLRQYEPGNPNVWKDVSLVFSSTDMDQWAANFLATVETIFSPPMASAVAVRSTSSNELYDPFVDNKESLAGSISQKTEYIYDEAPGTGDPVSAKETWRQALLRTLENDYGFSALTQLKALVTLHGKIEPDGDPNNPPELYGAVQVPGEDGDKKLPYSLTPTKLPLVEGTNWLNFLVSAQDPAAQRAFTLDLDYQVNQLEHLRDGAASACGYTPSSWLNFVLQQNPLPLPQGRENTLTQPIGNTRIPIPLRSYPPLPKLFATSATQNANIDQISKALTWKCAVTVERSSADQDSLTLSLSFNETETLTPPSEAAVKLLALGRPQPKDLYAALARFVFEYPQLQPLIDELVVDGGPNSIQAVKEFSELIAGAALTWPEWQPPQAPKGGLLRASSNSNLEVWNFEIQNVENSVNLMVKVSSSRGQDPLPWPDIAGYSKLSENGDTAIYQPGGGVSLTTLELSWDNLYILDYQNVRPSAYTERNANLAPPPQQTNPAFVYRTETVTWPTPVVPLVSVGQLIDLPSGASLKAAVADMLTQLSTAPQGSRTNGTGNKLAIETSIDYRYLVLIHQGSSVFSVLPVFLLKASVVPGNVEPDASKIAGNLATWHNNTKAESEEASLRFVLTIFSTTNVDNQNPLPLVQFPELVIPVGDDGWW